MRFFGSCLTPQHWGEDFSQVDVRIFFQMGLKPKHQRDFSPEGWDKLTSFEENQGFRVTPWIKDDQTCSNLADLRR